MRSRRYKGNVFMNAFWLISTWPCRPGPSWPNNGRSSTASIRRSTLTTRPHSNNSNSPKCSNLLSPKPPRLHRPIVNKHLSSARFRATLSSTNSVMNFLSYLGWLGLSYIYDSYPLKGLKTENYRPSLRWNMFVSWIPLFKCINKQQTGYFPFDLK